ncbi:MAG: DUF2800 domain-containing protein [Fluviibacter sp.]
MTAHAMLSASSSKRWLTCTPSSRLESTLPEIKRPSGAFDVSAEGTLAHSLAEIRLRLHYNQISSEEYNREYEIIKIHNIYKGYSDEDRDDFEAHVDNYVLYVRSQIGEGDTPLFEQRVDFSDWVPDGFGTADVIILSKHKVRVIDLKFGKGVRVDAAGNTQLRLYALGAYSKFQEEFPDIHEVEYTIHQPRLDSITTDTISITRLLDWANTYVKKQAKKAWAGSGEFVPGDHCQFCKAKAQCRARADYNNEIAKQEFREPPLLSQDEISSILSKASEIKSWLGDVEDFALGQAVEKGVCPTGYKLGTTSTHRKITDAQFAVVVLKEKGLDESALWEAPKLKSVSALEKLAPKGQVVAWLGDLIQRPMGNPKLVKIKDTTKEDFS